MLADLMYWLLGSSLIAKLFLLLILLQSIRALSKNDTEGVVRWAYALLLVLFLRDLTENIPLLNSSINALSPFFIVAAATHRTNPERRKIYLVIALLSALSPFIVFFFNLNPNINTIFQLLAALTALPLLQRKVQPITGIKLLSKTGTYALVASIVLIPLISLLLPSNKLLLNQFIIPLSYILLFYVLSDYRKSLDTVLIKDRDGLAENIDTLYGFVLRASDSLRAGGDLVKLMDYVSQTLAEETGADGSLVLMVDDFEDIVSAYALHGSFPPLSEIPEDIGRDGESIQAWLRSLKVKLGDGLIGEAAQTGKASLIREAEKDTRIVIDSLMPVHSLIVVPLLIESRVIGVALVARRQGAEAFGDTEFDRASLLADFASLVINNVFSFQDMTERTDIDTAATIAENIQKALRPKRIPDLANLSFGSFSSSARGVCGDYFDVVVARRDRVYVFMGDIAGKGVAASLIMVMIRAILHLVTNTDKDAATILSWVNRGITGKIDIDHFATLQILIIDPLTGLCEFANAGHRPPIIWREKKGLVDAIEMKSVPIGVEKATEFSSVRFKLENDDVLLLYTDGVVETINKSGRQFGLKGLNAMLHRMHSQSAKVIAATIRDDVQRFVGDLRHHDDQTVLVLKAKLQHEE